MASEQFRRQLSQESDLWQAEGLITPDQYQLLAERYQFQDLEGSARNRLIMILIGIGSILIGFGVITFVAANWQAWPRLGKLGLLLSLFLGVSLAGFYFWRRPHPRQRRLGHGLLLLASLILGANIALMAQQFHISGEPYTFFFLWGSGVTVMASGLQLSTLGILSLLLIGIGYFQGIPVLAGPAEVGWQQLILEHMPVIASLVFVPLAYACRRSSLFGLAAVLIILSLEVNLGVFAASFPTPPRWIAALAVLLPPALLWSYDDLLWPGIHSRLFRPLARKLAVMFLCLVFYLLSFHQFWDGQTFRPLGDVAPHPWILLIDWMLFAGLALYQWLRQVNRRREVGTHDWAIAIFSGIAALTVGSHFGILLLPVLGPVILNGLLFLLASGLIYQGVTGSEGLRPAGGHRSTFWFGMILVALQILSRLLEYETGLLLKSLVLSLCGIGVIIAGLWFERHLSHVKQLEKS